MFEEYTSFQFMRDIREALDEDFPPRRGALLAAAKKRYVKSQMISKLIDIRDAHNLDITPTVAKNLFKRVVGRSFDEVNLNQAFGDPRRTAAKKSPLNLEMDRLIEMFGPELFDCWVIMKSDADLFVEAMKKEHGEK